jgi:catechol O-methyltransferase
MSLRQRLPFLRWSVWRFAWGMPGFMKTGQIGDGREQACAAFVEANARADDIDDRQVRLPEVDADERGRREGRAVGCRRPSSRPRSGARTRHLLRLRIAAVARAAPSAKVYSVEFSAANAEVARRIWAHAGVDDRVTCLVGTLGDGGQTLDALANEHGFAAGTLDLMFIDHDKSAYLADLQSVIDRGWLHSGSIVVADNVRIPGAPKYRAYMKEQQGKLFNTVEHKTHVEYQSMLPDLVLESDYLGG